ncbi:septum formation initiator family protein [Candidatus Uhrbacteria bacterium]|nr:septum formation initiator family protein [Candidatus Uhrbacteria bacterium]
MSVFQQLIRSRLATIVIGIFLLATLYQTIRVAYKSYETQTQIAALQSQIDQSIKKREQLTQLQALLQSDFFAEREARIKLGMKKSNEQVAVIPIQDDGSKGGSEFFENAKKSMLEKEGSKTNNSTLWWKYFFSRK